MKRWSTTPRRPLRALLAVAAVGALVAVPAVASAVPSNPAADVAAGSAHADGIAWALGTGVSNGCTTTTFCPEAPLTRGQAATMMMRLAENGVFDAATLDGLTAAELEARFEALAVAGPQGETGPVGPAGVAGPAGPAADVVELTAQVEELEAELATLRYGGATVVTTIDGSTEVSISSPVSGVQQCTAPGCEHRTFAGHSVGVNLRQYGVDAFEYQCGEGQPVQTSVYGGADGAHLGSCRWEMADGGIPAGTTTIAVSEVVV